MSSKLPDSFTPIAQKYESIHSVTKRRCTYCGKLHRDGKCITHPRRTPYIKKNGKNKKIKNIDSSSNFHAGDPAKIISVSNQAPAPSGQNPSIQLQFELWVRYAQFCSG